MRPSSVLSRPTCFVFVSAWPSVWTSHCRPWPGPCSLCVPCSPCGPCSQLGSSHSCRCSQSSCELERVKVGAKIHELTQPGEDGRDGGLEDGGWGAGEDIPAVGEDLEPGESGQAGGQLRQEVVIEQEDGQLGVVVEGARQADHAVISVMTILTKRKQFSVQYLRSSHLRDGR